MKLRRLIAMMLAIVSILSVILASTVTASAASYTAFDKLSTSGYAKTYTLSTSGKTIPYTSKYLSTRGTVTNGRSSGAYIANSTDELYVFDVGTTNGKAWAYVSYPTSSRRVNAYIPLSAISSNNANHARSTSTGKFYCASRQNYSNSSSYYVAKGDEVYLVSKSGSRYQIMYPTSGGKYRLAWCNASDYNRYCTSSSGNTSTTSISNGTYYLVSACGNKVLDVSGVSKSNGANIHIWDNCNGKNQQFKITKSGSYYVMTAVHSGKAVDISGGSKHSGANVQQWEKNGTNAQKWQFISAGNGYYYIRSALGTYLDVNGAGTANGTNVHAYAGNGTNAQKWKLVSVSSNSNVTVNSSKTTIWPVGGNGGYDNKNWPKYNTRNAYHSGTDISAPEGTPVYATYSGVVDTVKYLTSSYGYHIIVKCTVNNQTVYIYYCHLSRIDVKPGATIRAGQQIGAVGSTGNSDGPHLHYEVRNANKHYGNINNPTLNPYDYLPAR